MLNLIAADLGASNGRVILGNYNGDKIEIEEIHKFTNGPERVTGSQYWDILRLFHEIKSGLRKASKRVGEIKSMGIDTWGVDYGLLDSMDNLLGNPYHYRDSRTDNLLAEIFKIVPKEYIYQETGIQFMQLNTLVQLYADLKYRPWVLENTRSLLFTPDLLNFFFTGSKYNEYTIASTSQIFNPTANKWSKELLNRLNLPIDIFRDIIHPGERIGKILSGVKDDCGLPSSIDLIAVGSHDTASAVAATPLINPDNSAYLSSGTWSLLGMELDKPIINSNSLRENFTNELGVEHKVRFLKNITGLWLIQECKHSWDKAGHNYSYQEIGEAAAEAKGEIFEIDPNDARFMNPEDMPTEIIQYIKDTGQKQPGDFGEMARGIYESLAKSYNDVITTLEGLTDKNIETIHMVGGGINAEILCQFTADYTKRRVAAGPAEATALGNIITQLMAAGEISSLEEGRELVRNSINIKEYLPR